MRLYSSAFLSFIVLFLSFLGKEKIPLERGAILIDPPFQTIHAQALGEGDAFAEENSIRIYTDFNCEPCRKMARETVAKLRASPYGSQLRVIAFPFQENDAVSLKASASAACASKKDDFWRMHDGLFNEEADLSSKKLRQLRDEGQYDIQEFQKCIESQEVAQNILQEREQAFSLGVKGLPTTFIGNYRLLGYQPYENIEFVMQKIMKNQK